MNKILFKLLSYCNRLILTNLHVKNSSFFLCRAIIPFQNKIFLNNSSFNKCLWNIQGKDNEFKTNKVNCSYCKFIINGHNNKIEIKDGVKLSELIVFVRGNHCQITISDKTTFNGGRIICQGNENYIYIGCDCMISDHVEIWNSDTHQILDEAKCVINASRPIHIGDHVWIGAYSKVLKGVTIRNGSVIGMGSLITKDIAERTLNVGAPSKCIKENIIWTRKFIDV